MCQLPDSRNPHHANFSVHDRAVSQENWLCSSFFEVRANAGRDTVPAPEKPSTGPPAKSKQADQRPRRRFSLAFAPVPRKASSQLTQLSAIGYPSCSFRRALDGTH